VASASAVVAQDAPVLEPSDGVFAAGSAPAMMAPGPVADDPVTAKQRRHQLADATIATVGEHATLFSTQGLDPRATVVHRIVAVAGPAGGRRDDPEVTPTDQDLRIARPPVVLRLHRVRVIARRDQRPVDHPRLASVM
jgi:hypothetical protein